MIQETIDYLVGLSFYTKLAIGYVLLQIVTLKYVIYASRKVLNKYKKYDKEYEAFARDD